MSAGSGVDAVISRWDPAAVKQPSPLPSRAPAQPPAGNAASPRPGPRPPSPQAHRSRLHGLVSSFVASFARKVRAAAALANDADTERIRDAVSVMLADRGFRENAARVGAPLTRLDRRWWWRMRWRWYSAEGRMAPSLQSKDEHQHPFPPRREQEKPGQREPGDLQDAQPDQPDQHAGGEAADGDRCQ
jgi:hypothetical protein